MIAPSLVAQLSLGIGLASLALAVGIGCSSSSSGTGMPSGCQGSACLEAGASADTGALPDVTPVPDGGTGFDAEGDGPHDGAAPDALYGACAVMGSFGWPCKLTASGADPTDCTDPAYPQCFVGGQGAWCTKLCPGGSSDCTTGGEDAGCVPTQCNGRGYCK